jgi:hypothetical protein
MDTKKRTIEDVLREYIEDGSPRIKRWERKCYEGVIFDGDPAEDTNPALIFNRSDLVGTFKIKRDHLIHKLKNLGLDEDAIGQLVPANAINEGEIELDTRAFILSLRHLRLYEEDIYEQFSDVIPNWVAHLNQSFKGEG